MPTYEYQCLDCGHKVEYFQSISEPPRRECPVCHGRLTRLVSSGAGLIFKGSGFYITDYKNKHSTTSTATNDKTTQVKEKIDKPVKTEKSTVSD